MNLAYRKATVQDLTKIIELLHQDDLGKTREKCGAKIDETYKTAFRDIDADPNQYLMVVENDGNVVGTCHLTLIPSLTFQGSKRLQIESVRVQDSYRGKHIGEWMIEKAIQYGKSSGATIVQLTTNKKRPRAIHFYEGLGFESTHEGMKLYL